MPRSLTFDIIISIFLFAIRQLQINLPKCSNIGASFGFANVSSITSFPSLGSILGEDAPKGPALPGARYQGPSEVERAHAVAEHKRKLEADGPDLG